MTLTDHNLAASIAGLTPAEREAVEKHLRGRRTPESWALIRQLRRKLKRKIRERVLRFKWLA